MTTPRPQPRRRIDPDMQNYIYKGLTAKMARERAAKRAAKAATVAEKARENGKA